MVVDGSRVEEFDFESLNKRQLAGNIYLAKVTRVEPSLQAAFVDYGGNRHGFLAFSEIHPDYYQIPVADREALLAAEAEAAAEANDDDDDAEEGERENAKGSGRKRRSRSRSRRRRSRKGSSGAAEGEVSAESADADDAPKSEEQATENSEAQGEEASDAQVASAPEPVMDESLAPEAAEAEAEPAAEAAAKEDGAPSSDASGPAEEDAEEPVAEAAAPIEEVEPEAVPASAAEEAGEEASDDHIEEETNGTPRSIAESAGSEKDEVLTGDAPADETAETETSESAAGDAPVAEAETVVAAEATNEDEAPASVETSDDDAANETNDDSDANAGEAGNGELSADADTEDDRSDAEGDGDAEDDDDSSPAEPIEDVGADDVDEEVRPRRRPVRRYKIQEVIKRRQILLVQVVKEERGNKGAALTSYISIAGRYCVLMPNTARGGGISRKITNASDRKRLKEIAGGLEVPKGMGLIVRTAGAERTKAEIKRDYDFLLRQWDLVRDMTLKSVAPTLIYEEGSLIKRSIRDLYSKEISAVQVEGEAGYREAKDYMKMLMPSHAKNVQPYRDGTPLFIRQQVEGYLNSMFSPVVQLKSGGYIVIGVTEALVAIDVNSGRSTKESSIENTALKTNLEAAEEVARQLRLRDLAGLIVIDFIDMEESRNNRAVEKRFKERLKNDRARLQVGRISGFGLLEMSRQRLRPGMLEATTTQCPHCQGQGIVRSDENLALSILRQLEEEGVKRRSGGLKVVAPVAVANFIVNRKRDNILQIEARYGVRVEVEGDAARIGVDFSVERTNAQPPEGAPAPEAAVTAAPELMDVAAEDASETPETPGTPAEDAEKPEGGKKRRRRRGRRGGRRNNEAKADENNAEESQTDGAAAEKSDADASGKKDRLSVTEDGPFGVSVEAASNESVEIAPPLVARVENEADVDTNDSAEVAEEETAPVEAVEEIIVAAPDPAPADEAHSTEVEVAVVADAVAEEPVAVEPAEPVEAAPPRSKRTGWWSLGRS